MDTEYLSFIKKSYWLTIGVVGLQLAVVGLVVYADRQSARRDQVIEQRTAAMIEDVFPEMFRDLGSISQKTSEIGRGVKDLKTRVADMDEHLSEVGRNVNKVSGQVEGVNQSVTSFFQDKSGLIWGHSLNPYVLIAMLLVIAASIPVCGWLFGKIRQERDLRKELTAELGGLDGFSLRLDRLHGLLERIRIAEEPSEGQRPELRKLVEETERLIAETRAELALMSRNPLSDSEGLDRNHENLH